MSEKLPLDPKPYDCNGGGRDDHSMYCNVFAPRPGFSQNESDYR